MALAAAQIVDAIAARIAGNTPAGTNVFTSRAWPLAESRLPAWRVLASDERVEAQSIGYPWPQRHELDVELQGVCAAVADLDDALHAMASAAITALWGTQAHSTLGGLNVVMQLQSLEREMQADGEAKIGRITLSVQVQFFSLCSQPDTLI